MRLFFVSNLASLAILKGGEISLPRRNSGENGYTSRTQQEAG